MNQVKQVKLQEVHYAYVRFQEAQRETQKAREEFIDRVQEAWASDVTQARIAEEIDLSRQRIAQFLEERKRP